MKLEQCTASPTSEVPQKGCKKRLLSSVAPSSRAKPSSNDLIYMEGFTCVASRCSKICMKEIFWLLQRASYPKLIPLLPGTLQWAAITYLLLTESFLFDSQRCAFIIIFFLITNIFFPFTGLLDGGLVTCLCPSDLCLFFFFLVILFYFFCIFVI